MLLYILLAVAVIIGIAVLITAGLDPYEGWGSGVFYGIMAIFVAVALSMLVCTIATLFLPEHEVKDGEIDLQQIAMGNQIHGSFFLGSGYVDGDLKYSFYAKNADGSYRVDSIYASRASIVEENSSPHIDVVAVKFSKWIFPDKFGTDYHRYVIHVPPGSIKQNINMDLPN